MNLAFLPGRVGKILSDVGKGNEIELWHRVITEYDPNVDDSQPDEHISYPCEGVLTRLRKRRQPGGNEQSGGMMALLRADTLPVAPMVGDVLLVNGEQWNVAKVETVKPSGRPILHKVEIYP